METYSLTHPAATQQPEVTQEATLKVGRSLSWKVLGLIFLASSVVTVLIAAFQIAFDYKQEMAGIENNFSLIEKGYVSSIAKSLWDMNESNLEINARGILSMPNIQYVEVWDNTLERAVVNLGARPPEKYIAKKEFRLEFIQGEKTVVLGSLLVLSDLREIYSKVFKRGLVILFSQFIKTLIVSTAIYLIVFYLLTRHILRMASYLEKLDLQQPSEALFLERSPSKPGKGDEFDVFIHAFNKSMDDLREAESRLVHSAKMSALGEVAAGIAHEIRGPLGAVLLVAEQINELVQETPIDKALVGDKAKSICRAVERVDVTIRGFKMYSRDGSSDEFTAVSIKDVIDDTLILCQEKLKYGEIKIEVAPIPEGLTIKGRAVQVSQVVLNLISNSCDALALMTDKWIRVSIDVLPDAITIAVTDGGSGIPEAVQKKLFQSFFTTKGLGKGTGLGLSVSKKIAQAHGGDLYIDSQSKNTRFVFRLPYSSVEPGQKAPKEPVLGKQTA